MVCRRLSLAPTLCHSKGVKIVSDETSNCTPIYWGLKNRWLYQKSRVSHFIFIHFSFSPLTLYIDINNVENEDVKPHLNKTSNLISVPSSEVDFVCLDFMPRHHSIVRYRVGRPNKLTNEEMTDPNYRTKKFREACSWVSFTFNREDYDWKYEFLISKSVILE